MKPASDIAIMTYSVVWVLADVADILDSTAFVKKHIWMAQLDSLALISDALIKALSTTTSRGESFNRNIGISTVANLDFFLVVDGNTTLLSLC